LLESTNHDPKKAKNKEIRGGRNGKKKEGGQGKEEGENKKNTTKCLKMGREYTPRKNWEQKGGVVV